MTVDPGALLASVSLVRVVGMGLLGFSLSTLVSAVYRTYIPDRVPWYVPVIVGVGAVGLWMNTASAIIAFVASTTTEEALILEDIETNTAAVAVAVVASFAGVGAGDRLAPNVRALTGATQLDREVSNIVRTVGRFTTVTLPKAKDIADIEEYEPVPQETKEKFAGTELVFARGLTVEELHRRITRRLRADYGVGHVDLELTEEGAVEYLGVGSRAAGIGPTLSPRQVALEIDADPAADASSGDRVQAWRRTEDGAERVATGELRGVGADSVTLAVDASRVGAIDQSAPHRIVTLPAGKQLHREFAGLLRAANETMESVTVDAEGDLVGVPVGAIRPTVVAVRPADGSIESLPRRERACAAGDTLYVVGRPDELRNVERAAAADPPAPDLTRNADGEGSPDPPAEPSENGPVGRAVGWLRRRR